MQMTDSEKLDLIISAISNVQESLRKRPITVSGSPTSTVTAIADASDLDGTYGNPEVRSDPKDWTNAGKESMKGKRYSQCSPDFLVMLAGLLDWQAGKADEGNEITK